jgi:hypothetical protein
MYIHIYIYIYISHSLKRHNFFLGPTVTRVLHIHRFTPGPSKKELDGTMSGMSATGGKTGGFIFITCSFGGCARRCSPRRTPCTRFFCGCARRCSPRHIACTWCWCPHLRRRLMKSNIIPRAPISALPMTHEVQYHPSCPVFRSPFAYVSHERLRFGSQTFAILQFTSMAHSSANSRPRDGSRPGLTRWPQ